MGMNYLGDFPTGQTIYVYFNTFDSNDPSASVTITGLAVTDIEIYKDGSTTQRASDSGYTLLDTDGIDFDSITGIHGFSIDTSDNTDAGFYAAGSDYTVIVSSVTVDAAVVNFIAATFSIDNRGLLRPSTAQRTLNVAADGDIGGNVDGNVVGSVASVTGAVGSVTGAVGSVTAGVTLANGAVTDASLAGNMEIVFETDFATNYNATRNAWVTNSQDFVGTTAADPFNGQVVAASVTGAVGSVTGAVGSVTGAVGSVTGNVGGNVVGSVASVTGAVGSVTGAVGSVTGNVGGNVTGSVGSNLELGPSEVNAEVVDALATDTYAEPGQGTPAATTTLAAKINYLYKAWRNRSTQTATTYSLYNDDATTVDQKATVSDDGTTADKGEVATGP